MSNRISGVWWKLTAVVAFSFLALTFLGAGTGAAQEESTPTPSTEDGTSQRKVIAGGHGAFALPGGSTTVVCPSAIEIKGSAGIVTKPDDVAAPSTDATPAAIQEELPPPGPPDVIAMMPAQISIVVSGNAVTITCGGGFGAGGAAGPFLPGIEGFPPMGSEGTVRCRADVESDPANVESTTESGTTASEATPAADTAPASDEIFVGAICTIEPGGEPGGNAEPSADSTTDAIGDFLRNASNSIF